MPFSIYSGSFLEALLKIGPDCLGPVTFPCACKNRTANNYCPLSECRGCSEKEQSGESNAVEQARARSRYNLIRKNMHSHSVEHAYSRKVSYEESSGFISHD